jgi:hypothetical protein
MLIYKKSSYPRENGALIRLSVDLYSDNFVTFQLLTHTLSYLKVYQIASRLTTMYFPAYICFLFNQVSCGLKRMPPHLRFTNSTSHSHPCGTYCALILQRDNAIFSWKDGWLLLNF